VALVGDDRLERVDDLRPCRGRQGVVPEGVQLVEQVGAERVQAQVQLEEDVLLALEVVVERRLGDTQALGDLAQRGLVVALLVEELEGDARISPRGRRS